MTSVPPRKRSTAYRIVRATALLFASARAGKSRAAARVARERAESAAAREAIEEALRESEERTQLIVSHALDAVVTIDIDGRITSWNPQAERLFGWAQDEVVGRLLSDTIIPSAYREAHARGLAHFRATGEGPVLGRRIELTALHRDGREFPVELAITPMRVQGATVFSAFLRDITERKQAEESRRESETRFRLLFASNPLPMWVYDVATLHFLEVNDAAIAHYGYAREEFLRMRITDIRPPEDVPRLQAAVAASSAAADQAVRRHGTTWRHRLKDGRLRDVDIASQRLTFAGREAAIIVATDVTELKQAETSLTRYAERLGVLHDIDRAIIAAEAPAAIAETALWRLRDLLGVPRAIVNLFDLEAGEVEWLAAVGRRRSRIGPGVRYPLQLAGDLEALRRGEPQIVDVSSLPPSPEAEALLTSDVRVYMVVPMLARGELIGAISFGGPTAAFPAEQVGIAQEVAAQLAIAIEQARLRERVTAAERQYHEIFENAVEGMFRSTPAGRYLLVNPALARLYGYASPEEMIASVGDIAGDLYADPEERRTVLRQLEEHGAISRVDTRARRKDGTVIWVSQSVRAIRDGAGQLLYYEGNIEDITERKRAEEARRESEASFRLLFASNPLPMWVYDVATLYFLEVNDAAIAHYGYAREEFLRMRITDIRPPEDVPRLLDAVAEGVRGVDEPVRRYARTWRHRLKDGRVRDVDIVSHAIDFGGQRATLVVAIDVTELKQAEESLARFTRRLEILHEIDRALIAAEAPEAIAEAALARLRDLLGVPRAIVGIFDLASGEAEWVAAAGRRRIDVRAGVRFPLTLLGDLEALRRGELQVIDATALRRSSEADALLASGISTYMVIPMIAGGELIGALGFGGLAAELPSDQVSIAREVVAQLAIAVTQARLHERVKRQAAELEERVEERTRELSAANAEADRANRAKSEFLSRMSHELRTPLNGIIGFAQLLELDALSPEQRESVDHIVKGGRHLLTLINEVLDIARIESDRLPISVEPVLASEVVRSALDLVRPQAAARQVTLSETVVGEHYVLADRQRLQQVLLNLLSNAVKYNRDGGSVTVSCLETATQRMRLVVSDTGRGIAPAMLERLFTPFDRLGAEEAGIEGTGLGLALSKRLVEAMDGALLVESRVNDGTTFIVELPRADNPAEPVTAADARRPDAAAPKTRGTVLYIEDNLANLRLFERIVARRPGLMLLSAMQGRRGLELARDHRPDVIVLDLHLPDLPGSDVLARLRNDPHTRGIPVVILSADATPGQTVRLLAQGARAYLTKPLDVSEVLALLDELLGASQG